MAILLSFLLSWLGAPDPAEAARRLEAVGFEHFADPVQRWRPLVEMHFPDEEVETALCIIHHESGGDPAADNPSSSATGLFQILASQWGDHFQVTEAHLFEPWLNTRIAGLIWERAGWWAWSPYVRGVCR
jgi:hypothetical protein